MKDGRPAIIRRSSPSEHRLADILACNGGVAGAHNRHQYDAERVEWLRRLSERLEELARPG